MAEKEGDIWVKEDERIGARRIGNRAVTAECRCPLPPALKASNYLVEGTWPWPRDQAYTIGSGRIKPSVILRILLVVRLFVQAGALLIDCLILLDAGSIFDCLIGERAEKLFFTRQQSFLSYLERTIE